jgi:phospholipase C
VNLTSPPLTPTCTTDPHLTEPSHFTNRPFLIDNFIKPEDKTCPPPGVSAPFGVPKNSTGALSGGCTRDLVHRFYQEQYQLNDGRQNRYVTGSDAVGLAMGVYDTRALPIYRYLHGSGHPRYAIADNFFQAAFGGSFLNHQWLIAARNPVWPGAVNDGGADDLHSVVDANGMPVNYPLYVSPLGTAVKDFALTASCDPGPGRPPTPRGVLCGDYAVNTVQPPYQPYAPETAESRRLPPQTAPTIGNRLSGAGVDWAWYSGGWSNANGDVGGPGWTNGTGPSCSDPDTITGATFPNCPDKLFQFHHQPFNYYRTYAPGTAARTAHLRDEQEFLQLARSSDKACNLKPVSFIKPVGAENEHPGYASVTAGSSHLIDLVRAVDHSRCARDTMVVVTYDEFGGQWDHVTPPGQDGRRGPHDAFGPGTRIPALVISPFLRGGFVVDHTQHDTTSVLATIERRFHLRPLSARDAAVHDLSSVFHAGKP